MRLTINDFFRNKDELTLDVVQNAALLILPGCQAPFTENEITVLKHYLHAGGRIFVMLNESDHNDACNINILLEEVGITPNMG